MYGGTVDGVRTRMQANIARLEQQVLQLKQDNGILEAQLGAHQPPKMQSAASSMAFGLPDIAEHIFLGLGIPDLLVAERVCKTWRQIINHTPSLQRKMFLLPDDKGPWRPLSWEICDNYGVEIDEHFEPRDYSVRMNRGPCGMALNFIVKPRAHMFEPGKKIRNMLITQPPIQEIEAGTTCCGRRGGAHFRAQHGGILRNAEGIRLGDLLDHAKYLSELHATCPHAHGMVGLIGDDGIPAISAIFCQRTVVGDEHPSMAAEIARCKQHRERMKMLYKRKQSLSSAWAAYGAAKQAAGRREGELEWHTWLRSQQHEQEASGSLGVSSLLQDSSGGTIHGPQGQKGV